MGVHANAIVTLAEAKERLFEKGEKNDTVIENLIDHFTKLVEVEAGRPAKKRTLTDERCDGTGTPEILLPWTPVQVVTSFEIRSELDDSTIETIADTTKFWIKSKRAGLVRLKESVFEEGFGNVLFTGDVGFETTDLEWKVIQEAIHMALGDYYPRWERRETSTVSKSYPEGSATFIAAAVLPPNARQALSRLEAGMGL